jgi:hypothetical protein
MEFIVQTSRRRGATENSVPPTALQRGCRVWIATPIPAAISASRRSLVASAVIGADPLVRQPAAGERRTSEPSRDGEADAGVNLIDHQDIVNAYNDGDAPAGEASVGEASVGTSDSDTSGGFGMTLAYDVPRISGPSIV